MRSYSYTEIKGERWKPIIGYEGRYEVSDYGRIKTIYSDCGCGLLKPTNYNRYLKVTLLKNGESKRFFIHRLVATAFIPNPENLPEVNHIDENPSNNNVSNLEWCDRKYNTNFGTRNKRIGSKNTNGKCSKPVLQFTKNGDFVAEYPSLSEVGRQSNIPIGHISQCCNGERKTAYGFVWKYK